MSNVNFMLPAGGDGGLLCAWLLGADLLLALLMIALILFRSASIDPFDPAAM